MWHFFEDIEVGESREFGSYEMTREEILDFGRRYDPQPFHVDEAAAVDGPFGGLVASGWHTSAICMRLMVDQMISDRAGSLGSPGAEEIRWLKPVRPGDTLSVRCEVLSKRTLESRPDRGLVRLQSTVLNQDGEVAMTMIGLGFFSRRDSD